MYLKLNLANKFTSKQSIRFTYQMERLFCCCCCCFILITFAAGKIVRQMLSSWKAIWQFLLLMDLMPTHFDPLSFKIVHTL